MRGVRRPGVLEELEELNVAATGGARDLAAGAHRRPHGHRRGRRDGRRRDPGADGDRGETPHIAARLESIAAPADGADQRRHARSGGGLFRHRVAWRASSSRGCRARSRSTAWCARPGRGPAGGRGRAAADAAGGPRPRAGPAGPGLAAGQARPRRDRPPHRRGGDRQEPDRPRAAGPAQPPDRPGADLALLTPSPRHHAVSGHPLPGAPAGPRRRSCRRPSSCARSPTPSIAPVCGARGRRRSWPTCWRSRASGRRRSRA